MTPNYLFIAAFKHKQYIVVEVDDYFIAQLKWLDAITAESVSLDNVTLFIDAMLITNCPTIIQGFSDAQCAYFLKNNLVMVQQSFSDWNCEKISSDFLLYFEYSSQSVRFVVIDKDTESGAIPLKTLLQLMKRGTK